MMQKSISIKARDINELILKLDARFQPGNRFELEDSLQEILEKTHMGTVIRGGRNWYLTGKVAYHDISIRLKDDKESNVNWLVHQLNCIGIAKGSILQGQGKEIQVGTLEGLAYYYFGDDLPEEVYKYLVNQMEQAMEGIGRMCSHWEGATYTVLYFYGSSFAEMKQKIEPFIAAYPLCQKSRIEQIA